MEGDLPDWLTVLSKCVSAAGIHEVPDLHCTVARGSGEEISTGVEGTAADPVLMALSGHYEVAIWHRPELPSCIVTSGGHNVFFGVVAETSDRHQMALECFEVAQVRADSFKRFVQRRVKPFALGDRRRLTSHFESTLRPCSRRLFLRGLLAARGSNL